MEIPENYHEINRDTWNRKTEFHLASDFYNMQAFLDGESSLNDIELELLGDVRGKSILHLQCHFGQDSLSLARMGAQVTGADLSDRAIEEARSLNEKLGLDARFVCCDLYDLPQHLDQKFDIVFSSYGTIGWLPDMQRWASVIRHFLKDDGRFVFAEFHPVVWMFNDDFTHVGYDYFNIETIVETENGTYADREADMVSSSVSWNHNLAEVFSALIGNGLYIRRFNEYDYSPYPCFRHVYEPEPGRFRIRSFSRRIPMVYALECSL
ncbi:MAG: class I SAM-dependent methyltransferase [Bacteroidia bacterium]|nr:class I SAM-dependent methyltransferase [Bacteroidia bacterium]